MSDSHKPYNALDAKILSITQKKPLLTQTVSPRPAVEPHLRISADFLSRCASMNFTKDSLILYEYMLLRCAPREIKRSKCTHLYGDVILQGEFFESKLRVAAALGKGHLKDKSKINWFGKTVKHLVEFGLVKQIRCGRRGLNATYLVFDVRELEPIAK